TPALQLYHGHLRLVMLWFNRHAVVQPSCCGSHNSEGSCTIVKMPMVRDVQAGRVFTFTTPSSYRVLVDDGWHVRRCPFLTLDPEDL
ncbi:MAG: hypothetical protein ACTHUP_04040, partial [Brevibacterium aurantiacum]